MSILPFTPGGESSPAYLTFSRDLTELKAAEQLAATQNAALAAR